MSAPEPAARRTRIRVIRPFTTHVLNPVSRRFVRWLPGFAILIYRGRKSGKTYRTPINLFRDGDAYVFALTYGSDVQWVRNVIAAGEADALIRRHMIHLTHPEVFVDPSGRSVPFPVRQFLGFMHVSEFLRMHVAPDPAIALDGLRDRGVD